METFFSILVGIVITAVAYLVIPVLFCTSKKQRTEKQIKKIVAINGICIWLIFMIIRISVGIEGTSAAVFLWSGVAYFLMKKFCLDTPNVEEQSIGVEQNTNTPIQSTESYNEVSLSVNSEQPTANGKFYGKDMMLEKDESTEYALAKHDENFDYNKSLQSMRCNSIEDIAPDKKSEISSKLSYREEKAAIHKDYKEKKKAHKNKLDSKFNKTGFKYATLILSLLLIVSITINTNQFIEKEDLIYQNETLSTKLEHLRERLDEAEENELKYFELYLQYSDKASFLTKRIALIDSDNPYYYHTYDCEDFQNADTFLAFNIEAAKNKGYVPHFCCY
jgi:hypothetical protein